MADASDQIVCAKHGARQRTYVCLHLAAEPKQRWNCDYPTEDSPSPDAWCDACNVAYQRVGAWNDENKVEICVLCSGCYEQGIGNSVAPRMEVQSEKWEPLVREAHAELVEKQRLLGERFKLFQWERYDWDQEKCEIVFSDAGRPMVKARVIFTGSISSISNTWLWGWSNFHFAPQVINGLVAVRDFGEQNDLANLTVPKWPADEVDGWEMTSIAAKVLNADGAYRSPDKTGAVFMLLFDLRYMS